MHLLHQQSSDPIGRALDLVAQSTEDRTEEHPLTPELFWERLKNDGFYFARDPPGSDEHGRFFAHLVLDHAVALRRVGGNPEQHHYWAIR